MAKNSNKPSIRFKGFTDAWEQRKLGEISEKTIEKNRERRYSETFTKLRKTESAGIRKLLQTLRSLE